MDTQGSAKRTRRATVFLALAAGALLAACSSASTSTTTTTTRAGGSTSTTRASSSTTSSTTTTSSALALCRATDLSGSQEGSSGAAGTVEVTFALKNVSGVTCQTGGYPGLQLLDASGNQLADNPQRGGSLTFEKIEPSTVVLAPGQTAWFNVGFSDVPSGGATSCPTAAAVQIIPPNDVSHLTVSGLHLDVCDGGALYSSPLFGAGTAATQTTAPPG